MNLFYTPQLRAGSLHYVLGVDESRHAVGVLRLGVGDSVYLTNGIGDMFECRVVVADIKGCEVEVVDCMAEYRRLPYGLHIAMAPTKNIDRYEWFLEKATEMGVDRITPVLVDRSERKVVKVDRSHKVVVSAAKQSLKAYVPQVDELTDFKRFVTGDFGADVRKYIAYCSSEFEKVDLARVVTGRDDVVVLIGPEGDFTAREVELAVGCGFVPISLGPSRLRTETAGVFVASLMLADRKSVV